MLSCITKFENVVIFKSDKHETPWGTLDDDAAKSRIEGYVYMNYTICSKGIYKNRYYVLNMGATLIFILQHIKHRGDNLHAENNECVLASPNYILSTDMKDEITLPILPPQDLKKPYNFDQDFTKLSSTKKPIPFIWTTTFMQSLAKSTSNKAVSAKF